MSIPFPSLIYFRVTVHKISTLLRPILRRKKIFLFICFWHNSPPVGQGLLIREVSGATALRWGRASSFARFLDHTQRRTTVGRTSLDEWSARRRDLYLTIHTKLTTENIHGLGGIRTHNLNKRVALDRAATGTGKSIFAKGKILLQFINLKYLMKIIIKYTHNKRFLKCVSFFVQ